ncbi:hypothetical protein [Paraburkholderia tropica]|uniref:hypothetical protein n=1 Tax=Paraburkholderia tropica TaxID=92647 RepID=UPI002AB6A001|nr:hypothetical protein [Paraburkholderia tropica]
MTPQKLLTWLGEFAKANPTFVASVSILTLGGIPLLAYALHIDQLPDFSLTDLTGALIATFITEVFVGVLLAVYLVAAGFAARWSVRSFYPLASYWSAANPARLVEQIEQTGIVDYLMKGRFIIGATVICSIVWSGVIVPVVVDWHAAGRASFVNWTFYAASLLCAIALTLADWRKRQRKQLHPWPKFALGGAMLLTWSVWLGWRIYAPGPVPPVTAQPAAATASAAAHDPSSGDWLTLAIHRLSSFNPLYCVAAIAAVAIAIYILTRWFKEIKTLFQRLVSDQEMRLRNAKIFTTALFGFAMVLPVLFLWAIVVNGKTELQTYVAVAGCVMLAMLNWLSFAAHRTTVRLLTMAGALFFCVAFVPLLMQNPTFYPQMVVRMLGLGNIYASSVTLSSQQCATLRPYGVDCEAKKDESITMTNVNILNRLGNSVLMELMVDDTQVCGLEGSASRQLPSSDAHGEIRLRELTLCHGVPQQQQRDTGCDSLLMERLRYPTHLDPAHLTCVHLSVPKDQLVGFTPDGARTYLHGYSHYVDAIKRPAPVPTPAPQPKPAPKPHPHPHPAPRPCDCLTRGPETTPAN